MEEYKDFFNNKKIYSHPMESVFPESYKEKYEENQYLELIDIILKKGPKEEGRNGTTYSIFGHSMRFSLKGGILPLLTTKQVAWKTCFKELMWFISGKTDNRLLQEQGVHIWDQNATREFLDSRGLQEREEGDLGPVYGHQWRHFNAPYSTSSTDYSGCGVDQLGQILEQLKDPAKRSSRRMVVSAWNPCQLDEMALPPCHVLMQFHVRDDKYLSCSLYQRSGDVGLGVPFNIASYSFLTHLLANHCGLEAEDFVYFLGNAHIYEEHLAVLEEQTKRIPYPFPRISLKTVYSSLEEYSWKDIELVSPYICHPPLKMDMIA